MARIVKTGYFAGGEGIAEDGLSISTGDLVTIKSGFVSKAVAGDVVEGISAHDAEFEVDNETVKKAKNQYIKFVDNSVVEVKVTEGTIAQTDVGALFNLGADGNVDATALNPTQLKLVKFITPTLGYFSRAVN